MKILIQNTVKDKRSNIKILEIISSELLTDEMIRYIKEDETPIIKFTDTNELFLIKDITSKYEQTVSDVLIEVGLDDLIPLSGGGGGSTPSYKVYTALLTQSGTDAPVATILENTLSGIPVWTRVNTGNYTITLTGEFTTNKTIVSCSNVTSTQGSDGRIIVYNDEGIYGDFMSIKCLSNGNLPVDGLIDQYIEIKVYN